MAETSRMFYSPGQIVQRTRKKDRQYVIYTDMIGNCAIRNHAASGCYPGLIALGGGCEHKHMFLFFRLINPLSSDMV